MASLAYEDLNISGLGFDSSRSTGAMWLFITTEAFLFVVLFFSYAYLGYENTRWPSSPPPQITLALLMLVILAGSSVVLYFGEQAARSGNMLHARIAIVITLTLACVFVVLQVTETLHHLETLKPSTSAYGSVFYTITSIHAGHIILGMCMLLYVLFWPARKTPTGYYPALHTAALYWHFVDVVWLVIVVVLYLLPRFTSGGVT